jgi:hypothetical protein
MLNEATHIDSLLQLSSSIPQSIELIELNLLQKCIQHQLLLKCVLVPLSICVGMLKVLDLDQLISQILLFFFHLLRSTLLHHCISTVITIGLLLFPLLILRHKLQQVREDLIE